MLKPPTLLVVAPVDRRRSLTELEGSDWGPPTYDSHLVKSCHANRDVPVGALDTEQIRILVGQAIGLPHLAPVLLEMLEANPWASGMYYEGDLVNAAVASRNHMLWLANPPELERLVRVIARLEETDDEHFRGMLDRHLRRDTRGLVFAFHRFIGGRSETPPQEHTELSLHPTLQSRFPPPGVCERVLAALEEPKIDHNLLTRALHEDNDIFWLLHRDAFRRVLEVLRRAASTEPILVRRREELEWAFERFAGS